MGNFIFLNEINKIYGKKNNLTSGLKNINLKINKGEFLAVMGPSGSGKTSLLSIIGLLLKPTSGEIYFNDVNISNLKYKDLCNFRNKNIGYLFQKDLLINNYTSIENSLMPTEYQNHIKDKNFFINFSTSLFSRFDLLGKKNKNINHLSGGERQRVAITRSLINKTEVIIADEPTSSLDSENANKILNYFVELNKEGKTIILATHNQDVAIKCNRIIYLNDGEIQWDKSKNLI